MSRPTKNTKKKVKEVKQRWPLYIKLDKHELYHERENKEFGEWSSEYALEDVQCYKNSDNIIYYECIYSDAEWEDGSVVFIVIEKISDGDSFGHCEADFYVRNAFRTRDEATDWINSHSHHLDYFEQHIQWIVAERNIFEKASLYCDEFGTNENIKFI